MRLIDTGLLKAIAKEMPALFTIIGVTLAIMCGLLLGGFVTNAAIEYLVESFTR